MPVGLYWFYSKRWFSDPAGVYEEIESAWLIGDIKPANSGSSVGVTPAANRKNWRSLDLAASFSNRIIVEPKVVNLREINCSVLGDYETIPSVCETISTEQILSYKDKYMGEGGKGMGGAKEGCLPTCLQIKPLGYKNWRLRPSMFWTAVVSA